MILYAVVARGEVVLAQWKSKEQGAQLSEILRRLDPSTNGNKSYVNPDKSTFHIMIHKGLIFLCCAGEKVEQQRAFAFLADMKKKFVSQFKAEWKEAGEHEFDKEFAPYMEKQAKYFSDPASAKITAVQNELEETRGVLLENIEKLMERERFLTNLEDSTSQLAVDADVFRYRSAQLARQFWWQNAKLWIIIIAIAAGVIFIIVWIACGFPTFSKCAPTPPAGPNPLPTPTPTSFR